MMTTYQLSGEHIEATNPPQYKALWTVTQVKGRWNITVQQPHRSNTAVFKVNKREQIVKVANSWVGANPSQLGTGGGVNCNDLSAKVYIHLGLPIADTTDAQYNGAGFGCAGDGCLLFYSVNSLTDPNAWNAGHVAVAAEGQRVNLNSITHGLPEPVFKEDLSAGVSEGVQGFYKAEVRSRSTVDLDED